MPTPDTRLGCYRFPALQAKLAFIDANLDHFGDGIELARGAFNELNLLWMEEFAVCKLDEGWKAGRGFRIPSAH